MRHEKTNDWRENVGSAIDILNWEIFEMEFKPTDITSMLSNKKNERISVPKDLEAKQIKIFDAVVLAKKVQNLMIDPRSIAALNVAEKYVTGKATEAEFLAAHKAAWDAARNAGENSAKTWEIAWALQNSTSASDAEKEAAWNRSLAAAWDSSYATAAAFAMEGRISEGLQAAIRARGK